MANSLKNMRGAHDVGGPGGYGLAVRTADQWLGGQMEDDLRALCGEHRSDGHFVSDIDAMVLYRQLQEIPVAGLGRRVQREPGDLGA